VADCPHHLVASWIVTFSERAVALFFWKFDSLKQRLVELASLDQDDPPLPHPPMTWKPGSVRSRDL